MLIKSSAKTAEIDCSWRNQFELSQKPYNGYYYDSQFWKRFSEHTAVYLFQSDAFTLLSCPENLWHKIKHFQPSELERKLNNLQLFCEYDDVDYHLLNDNTFNKDADVFTLNIESDNELLDAFLLSNSAEDIEKADFELDSHFFYGILEEGKLVAALASYCYEGKEPFESLSLLVSPKVREKGYGKRLLSHLVAEVKTRDRKVRYRVNIENTPSIKLCESLGFEAYNRLRVFTQDE
ncbi:TPA: N-acetyltransferase family protein [Vibrio parahaemolyticus]